MTLEEELTASLAEEMRKTIDFEVLCDSFVSFGWTVIEINYGGEGRHWIDVMAWADITCTGEYKEHNGKWLFEKEEDAIMFRLKWV